MGLGQRWLDAAYRGSPWLTLLRPLELLYRREVERRAKAVHHVDSGHDHARRAEAALKTVMLAEGRLHRVQLAAGGQALDGGHLGAVRLDGKREARAHRRAGFRRTAEMKEAAAGQQKEL